MASRRSSPRVELRPTRNMSASTAASVHDQRKRNRPPTSDAVTPSPATIITARTQARPEPDPLFGSSSLGQYARAVIKAASNPRANRRRRSPRRAADASDESMASSIAGAGALPAGF